MVGILVILLLLAGIWLIWGRGRGNHPPSHSGGGTTGSSATGSSTIRCPNCGSPAKRMGSRWECGWCGDHGTLQ